MLTIANIQVNGLIRPLGLDVPSLRFSWDLQSKERGCMPAASRVWIALTEQDLLEGGSRLWDSGQKTGAMVHLDYSGLPLNSCTRYWWKVAVWDESGQYAESAADYFDTGLYRADWKADWIWRTKRLFVNDFAYLRKEFALEREVVEAKLFASAHNFMKVYLNGKRLSGNGTPAPTEIKRRKYYVAYDVAAELNQGMNCIAAAAHYLGGSGQNYVNGLPGFRLQLHVTYADGAKELLVKTDTSWQALKEMPHRPVTRYQQHRRMSAIEDYDARMLDPAWLSAGFAAERCTAAVKAAIGQDEWPMCWQPIPEGAVEEDITPIELKVPAASVAEGEYVQVFDTGKIVSGWPRLTLKGIAGVTVQLRYSEDLDEHGRVKHNVCNEYSGNYFDQYTMRGDECEMWTPDFSYKAFRYIEVTGYPQTIAAGANLGIQLAYTNMTQEGAFQCSSQLLNDMFAASIQTQKNNTLGQPVDCPHREQAQYLADTDLQAENLLYNFGSRQVLEKTLSDFADGQLEDGTFPFVFPSNYEHPDFYLQIPEWDLHFATLLWKVYMATGDERLLEMNYKPACEMIDYYYSTKNAETGLVPLGKGWHISDWPYPTVDHAGEYLTVQQVKLWQAITIVAEIARKTGRQQDGAEYAAKAAALRSSILTHLFDEGAKRFRDSSESAAAHQGVNGLAVFSGLVSEEDRQAVIDYTAAKDWEAKTVLSLPLLRMMFENGHAATAFRLIGKEEYPGWGYMIAQGAKTMWEGWDDIESHCHAWNGYPARLLQEYVAGIQSAAPGFAKALIRPYFTGELTFAEASIATVRGKVAVKWERRQSGEISLSLNLPAGMTAQFKPGLASGMQFAQIYEGGATIWNAVNGTAASLPQGITGCSAEREGVTVELHSGVYEFTLIPV
ncbi:family 78 glycoside hydrolase catalytic domain [Paenibacillus sp. GCM10027626]|uniref:family 78 glycoside hydrolase catalytic domain n=1 Tax=Paenibacillus sp. GCM10027626 TaxID=3273411 RepID=UPI00364595F0